MHKQWVCGIAHSIFLIKKPSICMFNSWWSGALFYSLVSLLAISFFSIRCSMRSSKYQFIQQQQQKEGKHIRCIAYERWCNKRMHCTHSRKMKNEMNNGSTSVMSKMLHRISSNSIHHMFQADRRQFKPLCTWYTHTLIIPM